MVITDSLVTTRPLPSSGEVTIGRAPRSDLPIDDQSISRHHAILAIGPPLTVRDLGSANGTRVRDRELTPHVPEQLAPGDVVELGDATLIVQRRAPPLRAQRLWAHGYFEVRLEEECARARRDGVTFAVARLHFREPLVGEIMQDVLLAESRTSDVVGEYGPREVEVLLHDIAPDRARETLDRIVARFRQVGVEVQAGLACYPRDARGADELVAAASPFPREREPATEAAVSEAINRDRRMQDLHRLIERIAAGNIAVLVLGETGVGKEVMAEKIHKLSPRAAKPYLRLNCAALTESLLESELFGHERGAFTGAVQTKQGLLETADGGTVFLDEIGELPHSLQVKLLRVLEERSVMRVGGLKSRTLDVRFISATNRDLEAEITRGTFRQDLYFRLNGASIMIPPLRERASEISSLARAFLHHAATQMSMPSPPPISEEAMQVMLAYAWPGNIRELRNVVERAVLLSDGNPITPEHLPLEKMRGSLASPRPVTVPPPVAVTPASGSAAAAPASTAPPGESEKDRILRVLAECAGNQSAAARILGIGRRTLINRLDEYGVTRPRKGR
ncbi:MAG TPA: sigma 54-interacting transcriptional regulator [Kofleriaceae bacterium]|nr:sigma 54-interacting transcriptional regulator [Kofleriaceae bacterium]